MKGLRPYQQDLVDRLMAKSTTARERILTLLQNSPPLLCSQIAWRLGMKVESVSAHLGVMRRGGLTLRRRIYFDTPPLRFGWRLIRPSEVYWTLPKKRQALYSLKPRAPERRVKLGGILKRPISDDMRVMIEDLRRAAR